MSDATLTLAMVWLVPLATLCVVAVALALSPLAQRFGWLDQPAARKVHKQPTPVIGGMAIFIAFFSLSYAFGMLSLPFLLGSAIVLSVGVLDDRWELSAATRFLAQALAALVMIYWGGVLLQDFGRLAWDGVLSLGPLSVPITVFSALGVINAFNMIDGMDGASGGVFLIATLALVLLMHGTGDALWLGIGCVFGFLLLNARWPWNARARIFLGDSGSMLLGFWLAWWFIAAGSGPQRAIAPMTAVWIFGLPLLDTTRLMIVRWKQGKSAFSADQNHLHHAFLLAGFSVRQSWLWLMLLSLAFALIAITFELAGTPEYIRFYLFIGTGVLYLKLMKNVWSRRRLFGRSLDEAAGLPGSGH